MKFNLKFAAISAFAVLALSPASKADYTLNFYAGDLRDNNGVLMPVGGLLELVADTSRNGFTSPTATSFTSGDDLIIASFALNGNLSGNGVPGQTANTLTIKPSSFAGLDAGDPLIFRWFPKLTYSSNTDYSTAAPGSNGLIYGQFSTNVSQDGSSLNPPWTEPADTGSYSLTFITMSRGGSNNNSLGYAVPEPATYAMSGVGLIGLVGMRMWSRRSLKRA